MITQNLSNVLTKGYVGEFSFARLLFASKIPPCKFDSLHLIKVAEQSKIGLARIAQAKPYLISEYGTPTRKPDGSYRIELDWKQVPSQVILDKVYGLDAVISFRGWCIGIDVTTNGEALIEKRQKLQWLTPLWQGIGIDHVVVIYLLLRKQSNDVKESTAELTNVLRIVIKNQKKILSLSI